ncbi:MAG: TonB-dependent receptor [Paludibacter sp.]|nr:TonB-dependent receptor [Paludibacter sp.]
MPDTIIRRTGTILFALLLFTVSVMAQNISGKVEDAQTKEPIVGATVAVKGTTTGTITDINGSFNLNVSQTNAELQITYIGYKSQTVKVEGRKNIVISLSEDAIALDQVVVIGYGVQRKSDLTGAISSIKGDEIAKLPTTMVVQALQGKAAGVEVVQNSGAPGSSSAIRIRGMGTINDSDPLYIVDGIPMDNINYLSSDDISSIEILKDASSAAIYGSRAANGVVLIQTKSGKDSKNKVNVNFNSYVGWQESWKDPGVMKKEDFAYFADFVNDLHIYTMKDAETGEYKIKPETQELIDKGSDWWDELSRKGMMQKYNISLTGGSDKLNYYASANWMNTDGIIKESDFDRKSFNIKMNTKLLPNLQLTTNLTYAKEKRREVGEGTWGVIKTAINYNPLTPIFDQNESYNWTTPVENLRRTTFDSFANSTIGQVNLDWDIIKGLKYSFRASYANYYSDREQFLRYNVNPEIVGSIRYDVKRSPSSTENISMDNILNYNGQFGKHNLNVMVGQTMETSINARSWSSGTGYGGYDNVFNALNFAQFSQSVSGYSTGWTALGLISRLSYNYDDKYLFQANFRADASSRFNKKNRWGTFPSVSLGWKLNSEDFLVDAEWISLLKVRAGWGQLGNNRVGNFAYETYVGGSQDTYIYGIGTPSIQPGLSITQYGNYNIRWERTQSTSLGLDANFFNNKITTSVDYFVKDTHDMLIGVPLVYSAGYVSTPMQNAGSIRNEGWEIQINHKNSIGDFSYEIGGNFTRVNNMVTALGTKNEPIYGGALGSPNNLGYVNKTVVGAPIACYYGWKTDGIMTADDFENGVPVVPVFSSGSTYTPGDMKFVDINADGIIDDNDKTFIGSPHPDFFYGINLSAAYKGFDLSMFFQGVYGTEIYNVTKYFGYSTVTYAGGWIGGSGMSYSNVMNDYFEKVWRPEPVAGTYREPYGSNLTGTVPLPSSDGSKNEMNFRNSDFYIEDGSYLRLKNIQLGYTFPKSISEKLNFKNLKLYATASNVLTFTKYEGLDPEIGKTSGQESNNLHIGIDQGVYPQARSYMLGVIIDF